MARRSTGITRTTWVVAVPLVIAVVASVIAAARHGQDRGGYSPNSTASISSSSAAPYPGLSAAFVSAVNSTDVQIAPVSESASVTEGSAATAALAQLSPGSSASAAELVTLTNSQYPNGVLAWAIDTDPAGGYQAPSYGPAGYSHPAPERNFRVDFVDAATGTWLEGVEGYSSGL
jgi:hypothetical protein